MADLSEAIRIDPKPAYRYQERGELHERRGDLDRALADFNEAIARDPTRAFRFHRRANIHRAKGNLARAIADWDEAIRLDPVPRAYRHWDRANALRDAGRNDKALADYETVLRLEPNTPYAYVDRGKTYAAMGNTSDAKNDFETALRLHPGDAALRVDVEEVRRVLGLSVSRDSPESLRQEAVQPREPQAPDKAPASANETTPPRNYTPAKQSIPGEFARLLAIPPACQKVRDLATNRAKREGIPARQIPRWEEGYCEPTLACQSAVIYQLKAGQDYMVRSPEVFSAFKNKIKDIFTDTFFFFWKLPNLRRGSSDFGELTCAHDWVHLNKDFFALDNSPPYQNTPLFNQFRTAGQALLDEARAEYKEIETEFRDLISFNDRYAGEVRLERAQAAYRKTYENDDLGGMMRAKPVVLEALADARVRKELLTSQSDAIARERETLSDIVPMLERDGLTSFTDQATRAALAELVQEIEQLGEAPPSQRGDISAKLEVLRVRVKHIESVLHSARSAKAAAEKIRVSLVENEGAANRLLQDTSRDELKEASNEQLKNAANELIGQLRHLQSLDLSTLHQKQTEVEISSRKLKELRQRVDDLNSRYDRAKRLDVDRHDTIGRIDLLLIQVEQPDMKAKFSADGLDIISKLKEDQRVFSQLDTVRFFERQDYSDVLASAKGKLTSLAQMMVQPPPARTPSAPEKPKEASSSPQGQPKVNQESVVLSNKADPPSESSASTDTGTRTFTTAPTPPPPPPPPAPTVPLPDGQRKFVDTVQRFQSEFAAAGSNEFMAGATRPARKQAMCALGVGPSVRDWIGTLRTLSTNNDGKGVVSVEIGKGIEVKTWNNALSDIDGGTLIEPGSPLFEDLAKLRVGQLVRFTADLVSDRGGADCYRETSLTMRGSMTKPEFLARFSVLRPI